MIGVGSVFMRFGADFGAEQVERLREKLLSCLELGGVTGPKAYVLVTVVDELVCNILEHSRASWIELELNPEEGKISLKLRDDGQAFDPVAAIGSKGPDTAVENDSERSLGLFMVGQLTQSCRYRRLPEGVNELNFEMKLGK